MTTTQEAKYVSTVWVQPAPEINRIPNPHAQFNVDGTIGRNVTVARSTSVGPLPYGASFALTATGTNDSSFGFESETNNYIPYGMEEGKTYTIRGTFHLTGALSGSPHARARRIAVFVETLSAPGVYTEYLSAQAPNVAGATQLSVEFSLPPDTSEVLVRFYHGHSTGTAYWYALRLSEGSIAETGTDYWDGDSTTGAGYAITDTEYGWDGAIGNSTSWKVDRNDAVILADADIEVSYDVQRTPFVMARIQAPNPGDEWVETWLEPRKFRPVILNWTIDRYVRASPEVGPFTTLSGGLPTSAGPSRIVGKLWLADVDEDAIPDTIVLVAGGAETALADVLNMTTAAIDTGSANVAALVRYAATQAGLAKSVEDVSLVTGALVPSGDRRLWLQGSPAADLYESELGALDYRLYADDRGRFYVASFDDPPTNPPTLNVDLSDGDGPFGTLISLRRSRSRDQGGYADAVMVRAEYDNAAGDRVVAFQSYFSHPGSTSRRGLVVNLRRAIPNGYAAKIAYRALRRGEQWTLVAFLDPRLEVGRGIDLELSTRSEVTVLHARAITYRPSDGTMEIQAHIYSVVSTPRP